MIVIDPSKGGSDIGLNENNIIEKDFNLLISQYIYDRLNELNIDTKLIRNSDEYIGDTERVNRILNSYGNNSSVVAISNQLGNNSGVEIIYALRNKDKLAKLINDNLEDSNIKVDKYYQRRSENDTSKDYYDIQRNTGNIETIIIKYDINEDLLNNYKIYAEAIVKSLANYQNKPYFKEGEYENIYIVKKGDSLYSISKKYNTTVDDIKKLNNLTSNLLSIGQRLNIPIKKVSSNTESYIVQKGDTLYSISRRFNMTVDQLKKINNLTSNILKIGQILNLNNLYTVQKGDTLYSIARRYNTTIDEIKRKNNLKNNLLSIGQQLKI